MLVVQITDPHIFAAGQLMEGRVDTAEGLREALGLAQGLQPDLILMTGDLVNDGQPEQYAQLRSLIQSVEVPLILVAGNHDDRPLLRALIADLPHAVEPLPEDGSGRLEYDYRELLSAGGPRIIVVDTVVAGRHDGHISDEQIAALVERLESGERTLIAQHHPPYTSGIGFMDAYGLAGGQRELESLRAVPGVMGVVTGHLHRHAVHHDGSITVVTAPSSAAQVALDLEGGPTTYTDEPGAVLIHLIDGSSITTHVQPLGGAGTWRPSWAQ